MIEICVCQPTSLWAHLHFTCAVMLCKRPTVIYFYVPLHSFRPRCCLWCKMNICVLADVLIIAIEITKYNEGCFQNSPGGSSKGDICSCRVEADCLRNSLLEMVNVSSSWTFRPLGRCGIVSITDGDSQKAQFIFIIQSACFVCKNLSGTWPQSNFDPSWAQVSDLNFAYLMRLKY